MNPVTAARAAGSRLSHVSERWREYILCGLVLLAFVPSQVPVMRAQGSEEPRQDAQIVPQTVLASVATPLMTPQAGAVPTTLPAAPLAVEAPSPDDNVGAFAVQPGQLLPSDAECAARVTRAGENRPANAKANKTKGKGSAPLSNWGPAAAYLAKRVTGGYAGTTDELIQWASCKWGFDPDPVRAQVMVESGWRQGALGGYETNPAKCADKSLRRVVVGGVTTTTQPGPATTPPPTPTTTAPIEGTPSTTVGSALPTTTTTTPLFECPTAFGLLQVRSDYHPGTYPMSARSTAYNLDYSLAMKRACYEGVGWLGARTRGDAWGCVGVHYSGQWHDPAANSYIERVKSQLAKRSWE